MMKRLFIRAFAKINLMIDVLGKRPDGYHEVSMIMQGIQLHDVITLEKTRQGPIEFSCNWPHLEQGPENLAYVAARLLMNDYPQVQGLRIHLQKAIPLAAGLGGGSADAAGVIMGIDRLFALNLPHGKLQAYAARIGSDVPFCLNPLLAIATGRGEVLQELAPGPLLWMVVAKPPFGVATKAVYEHLHRVTVPTRPDLETVLQAIKTGDLTNLYTAMANVLEFSTFDLHPQLREWREELLSLGAGKVMMSGSGPTLLAFSECEEKANKLALTWKKTGWDLFVTRSVHSDDIERRIVIDE